MADAEPLRATVNAQYLQYAYALVAHAIPIAALPTELLPTDPVRP